MLKLSKVFIPAVAIAVPFIWQQAAFADAGTPLIWLGILHLLFGNAVIGIIEGLIIAKLCTAKKIRSIVIMILANYVSIAAGVAIFIGLQLVFSKYVDLYSVTPILILLLVFSFVLTVFIELPFCAWILKKAKRMDIRPLRASIILQTVSYALLIPLYFLASGVSLLTKCSIEKTPGFVKTPMWIYYISADNQEVMRIKADGSKQEHVAGVKLKSMQSRLFVNPTETEGKWDLFLTEYVEGRPESSNTLIMKDFSRCSRPLTRWDGATDQRADAVFHLSIYDFRPDEKRDWRYSVGTWALVGLYAENKRTGKTFQIALETPFIQWNIKYPIVLPDDQVVFQLGDNQIAVVDVQARKLALLAHGRGPVASCE